MTGRPATRGTGTRGKGDEGQAAVELALVLPLVAILLLALVQVGLIVRDQILVLHAAREAAREAAVDPGPDVPARAAAASSTLDASRLTVESSGRGGPGIPGPDPRKVPGTNRRSAGRESHSRRHPRGICHYES